MKRLLSLLVAGIAFAASGAAPVAAQSLITGDAIVTCGSLRPDDPVMALAKVQWIAAEPKNRAFITSYIHPAGWSKRELGGVFGICQDRRGNIYVTAARCYPGTGTADAGKAGWGGIYKISAATLAVENFVTTEANTYAPVNQIINGKKLPNAFAGLGNICYDSDHNQFFVTNLEDGMIYRIAADGTIKSRYDPFQKDDGVNHGPGIAVRGERLWGIAYRKTAEDNGKVYFARWIEDESVQSANSSNDIYSIDLNAAGEFDSPNPPADKWFTDAHVARTLAISMAGRYLCFDYEHHYSNPVSDIEFSAGGRMLLAERGPEGFENTGAARGWAHRARLLEYKLVSGVWTSTDTSNCDLKFEIGIDRLTNSAGGCAWGDSTFNEANNVSEQCDSTVWVTADAIHFPNWYPGKIYGAQRFHASKGGGVTNSHMIDFDNDTTTAAKGFIGDIDVVKNCTAYNCNDLDITLTAQPDCCWDFSVVNNNSADGWWGLLVNATDDDVSIRDVTVPAGWTRTRVDAQTFLLEPTGYMALGTTTGFKVCLNPGPTTTQHISFSFVSRLGGKCVKNKTVNCSGESDCFTADHRKVECFETSPAATSYRVTFRVRNLGAGSINRLIFGLDKAPAGASVSPTSADIASVAPNGYTADQTLTLRGASAGDTVCVLVGVGLQSGDAGFCFDTICFVMPACKDCCDTNELTFANEQFICLPGGNVALRYNVTATPRMVRKFTATIVEATETIMCPWYRTPVRRQIGATFNAASFLPTPPLPGPFGVGSASVNWGESPAGGSVNNSPLYLEIKLPAPPDPKCCDSIRLCVKYTWTDTNCRTCDTTICYEKKRRPVPRGGDNDRWLEISMNTPNTGVLKLFNPVPNQFEGADAAVRVTGITFSPRPGTDLVSIKDSLSGNTSTPVDRVATVTPPTPIESGQSRLFPFTYNNWAGGMTIDNDVVIRYVHVTSPLDTMTEAMVVQARLPSGKGGDSLKVNTSVSLTNVRTYGLEFRATNTTQDSICRLVVSVSPAGNDRIMAAGPGRDSMAIAMSSYRVLSDNSYSLRPEQPKYGCAVYFPVIPGESYKPLYVTVCGGADNFVTFNFAAYNGRGELVTSGSLTTGTPLAARGDDPDATTGDGIAPLDCTVDPVSGMITVRVLALKPEAALSLVLTDEQGGIVGRLLDGESLPTGERLVHFDAAALRPGTYWCTLTTPTATQTRRILIAR